MKDFKLSKKSTMYSTENLVNWYLALHDFEERKPHIKCLITFCIIRSWSQKFRINMVKIHTPAPFLVFLLEQRTFYNLQKVFFF